MAALIAATPYARLETSLLPDALRVRPSSPPHTFTEMTLRPCLLIHQGVLSFLFKVSGSSSQHVPLGLSAIQVMVCSASSVAWIATCDLQRSIQRT